MSKSIKKEFEAFRLLLSSVPPLLMTLFVMSIFSMNLLANKSIALPVDWLALDCGFIVSWFAFLTMDVTTRHFGPKAASQLSVFALFLNLAFCLLFFIGSRIPGVIMMVGLQGSGKTTASAKLAYRLTKMGHTPLLAACDVYRPAAADQLQTL